MTLSNTVTTLNPPTTPSTQSSIRHYNFLSVGARGVGKTVFFAGHYHQLTQFTASDSKKALRFDCNDTETKETLQKIEDYVANNQNYPPATMKMTNFDFLVQQKMDNHQFSLSQVCWWDTPGESCQLYNPAFLTMMLNVDGSCLFLDAQRLVECSDNQEELQEQLQPIETFAELLHHNNFHYPIALILTKCDLLTDEKDWQTLNSILESLRQHWHNLGVNHRLFYSEISIVQQKGRYTLQTNSLDNAMAWLVQAAQANEKSQPKIAVADACEDEILTQTKKEKWSIPVFLKRKAALVASFLVATSLLSIGGIFLVEQAVNSEQETPVVTPAQS